MVKVKEDLTSQQFGKLTVLHQVEDYVDSNGRHIDMWLCECSCEEHNKVIVRGNDLKHGKTQSCGCLIMEKHKKFNQYQKKCDEYGDYYVGITLNTGNEFYVDDQDYDLIKNYCWCEMIHKGYHCLVAWNIGSKGNIIMSHLIMGKYYDHKDRNPLNNRRHNLRESTLSQNSSNRSVMKNNSSGVTGIHFDKKISKWVARIQCKNKRINLGRFNDKIDAIKARLRAEIKYFGEFAPQKHLFKKYGIIIQQNNYEKENTDDGTAETNDNTNS